MRALFRFPIRSRKSPTVFCTSDSFGNWREKRYLPFFFMISTPCLQSSFCQHLIAQCVCGRGVDEVGPSNKGRARKKRTQQETAAADEDGGIGAQIHLQLAQLIENAVGVELGGG